VRLLDLLFFEILKLPLVVELHALLLELAALSGFFVAAALMMRVDHLLLPFFHLRSKGWSNLNHLLGESSVNDIIILLGVAAMGRQAEIRGLHWRDSSHY